MSLILWFRVKLHVPLICLFCTVPWNLFLLVFLLIFSHLLHWRSLYCSVHLLLPMCIELMTGSYYMVRLHFQEFFSLLDWTWSHQFLPRLLVVCLHLQYRFLLRFVASERVTCKWACHNLGWLSASNQCMLRNVFINHSSASNLYIVSSTIAECLQSSLVTRGDFSESVHIL